MRNDRKTTVVWDRILRRRCTMRTIPDSGILYPIQYFFGSIDCLKNIEIFNSDHFLTQQCTAYPIEQTFPIFLSNKNDRKRLDLPCLNQRDRFEQFVKRPETARQNHERDRVLHEHHFPYEEISEVEKLVCIDVRFLFQRQFDIQTNGSGSALCGTLVCSFHDAGAATGNDRISILSQQRRNRLRFLISRTARQRSGGAKHCYGRRNFGEHFKTFNKFRQDAKYSPLVLSS